MAPFGKRSGWDCSRVAYGAWQIGGDWGGQDAKAHEESLHTFLDGGGNLIDTANVYGAGASESFIGKVLAERKAAGRAPFVKAADPKERCYVITKVGRLGEGEHGPSRYTLDAMRAAISASRDRLQLGGAAVDLVQLHCPPKSVLDDGSAFASLEALKAEGLIEQWGVSVETVDEAMVCIRHAGCASVQIILNCLRLKPTDAFLPAADAAGVAVIARLPLAGGLLGGHLAADTKYEPHDHRSFNRHGECFDKGETFSGLGAVLETAAMPAVDALRGLVPSGATLSQLALRWVLDQPAVSCAIPGSRTAAYARSNAAAAEMAPLGAEVHAAVKATYEKLIKEHVHGSW